MNPLTRAIDIVGLHQLAAGLTPPVTYQAIRKFEKTIVPAERVIQIAELTNWHVTPHELRDDIYPHPHDALPEHLRVAA